MKGQRGERQNEKDERDQEFGQGAKLADCQRIDALNYGAGEDS